MITEAQIKEAVLKYEGSDIKNPYELNVYGEPSCQYNLNGCHCIAAQICVDLGIDASGFRESTTFIAIWRRQLGEYVM